MTNADLIEHLQLLPGDAEVYHEDGEAIEGVHYDDGDIILTTDVE